MRLTPRRPAATADHHATVSRSWPAAVAVLHWLGRHPLPVVLASAVCLAFTGILFIVSGTSPSTATFFRCLYALPLLGILTWLEDRSVGPRPWAARRWAYLAGVFFASDLIFFHHSIDLMGAGLATVMSNLQVIIVGVAAWVFIGERPLGRQLAAVPVALAGILFISGVVGGSGYGRDPGLGVVLGLIVATSYGAYLLLIRKGRDRIHVAGPIFDSTLACLVAASIAGVAVGDLDLAPTWPGHGWLLLLALSAQVAAGMLLALALPRLPAITTSLLLLVQPVLSVVLAMFLVDERPSGWQLAGVALVLVGVAVGTLPAGRMVARGQAAIRLR
jgi:drug/metabolite transporter (DMT)-like permease